jgi:hypothetical protein
MAKKEISKMLQSRAEDLLEMLAQIPKEAILEQVQYLLNADRFVNGGRENGLVREPDNGVRLRMVEIILSHGAGSAGKRKPIEPPADTAEVAAVPAGSLRPAAKAIQQPEKSADT